MIETIIRAEVDLDKGVQKTPLRCLFAEEDNLGHRFDISVMRSGVNVDLTGGNVFGYLIRYRDQSTVPITGTVSGNHALLTLNEACYAQTGQFSLVIKVVLNGARHAIFCGDGSITRSRTDSIVDTWNVIPSLDELLAKIDAIDKATSAAQSATTAANTAASNANTAASNANTAAGVSNAAASNANSKATAANAAATAANTAAGKIDAMTVSATGLAAGAAPTVSVTDDGTKKIIAFGIPKGDKGDTGATGATGPQGPKGDTGSVEALPYAATAPKAPGTASAGTAESIARGDHVHPAQTSVTGNAGTATKLKTARKIGNASFDGSADITLAQIGAYAAGSIRVLAVSLAASAWTGSGPYTATITRSDVTTKTWVDVYLDASSQANYSADINWSTETAGKITLTTAAKPTGTLAGSMVLTEVTS